MKIVAGLGNPGIRYRNTRHNAGFMVLAELSARHRLPIKKKGFGGLYGIGRIQGEETVLFEPMTYMNRSGEAVKAACERWLERREDLLVVSDDVNLPLGAVRIREKGSAGGHNGLKSIIEHLGEDFSRLRIGVGMGYEQEDMADHVLSAFPRKDRPAMKKASGRAVECIESWLKSGVKETMSRFNANISLEEEI